MDTQAAAAKEAVAPSLAATDSALTLTEFVRRLLGYRVQPATLDGSYCGHLGVGFGGGGWNTGAGYGDGSEYGNGNGMGHGDGESGLGNGHGYGHGESHELDEGGGYDYSD